MGSARRIVVNVSTAVKQRRGIGIPQWSMASARRIDLSTATDMVKQWSNTKNRDLSTSVMRWRGSPQWPATNIRVFENRFIRHDLGEVGYTVDVADLLFSPERDFLIKNNGQKIKVDDLRGKTIVLFIVPLDKYKVSGPDEDMTVMRPGAGDTWDMIDAYNELLRVGSDVEFVFVPVRFHHTVSRYDRVLPQESLFHDLFSAMPFPAIPFSDVQGPKGPVVQTFSLDVVGYKHLPYWVVIDPTNTVVATRYSYTSLFKLFGGAELHPFSRERIEDLYASYGSVQKIRNRDLYASYGNVQQISKWDQLLASDSRDFLLSSNGDKVPISSLKGKLVGLYFCENIPIPPRFQAIKKVYEEAKSRGYDFEIVQITFHYHPFNAIYSDIDPSVQQCCEEVSWLTLPFKDPGCRQVQRILHCVEEKEEDASWAGDSLVLIYPRQGEAEADHNSELLGAEILEQWGIEAYPFTRPSLYKLEYEVQKREITLQSLLSPVDCLQRSVGDGNDLVDAVSQLSGKRVLVFFAPHSGGDIASVANFVSMLKSEYEAQSEDNVEEESKFEVVYISTVGDELSFEEFTKEMPWLVLPLSKLSAWRVNDILSQVFKAYENCECVVAFNERGELIAKADYLPENEEGDKLQFPFIDQDLEKFISMEVDGMCIESNFDARHS